MPLPLGGPKQLTILANLILQGNTWVSLDNLVAAAWSDNERYPARTTVHAYLSRLRKALAEDNESTPRITQEAGRYRLRVEPGELDAEEFNTRVEHARTVAKTGDLVAARADFQAALALWTGTPLPGLTGRLIEANTAKLTELRYTAMEECWDIDLATGNHAELIPELCAMLHQQPLRERIASRLMIAFYRHDRISDALHVYRQTRDRYIHELGMEPGAEIQGIHQRILQSDDTLKLHATATVSGFRLIAG